MSPEQWSDFTISAENSEEWGPSDREWLSAILQTGSAKRLFGVLFEKLRQYERDIAKADLVTEGGVRDALRKQGEMTGVELVIDTIRMLTEEEL